MLRQADESLDVVQPTPDHRLELVGLGGVDVRPGAYLVELGESLLEVGAARPAGVALQGRRVGELLVGQ